MPWVRKRKREWDKMAEHQPAPNMFTPEECDRIIALHEKYENQRQDVKPGTYDYRKSDVFWLPGEDPDNRWIFQRIEDFVLDWNEKNFQFEVEGCENLQLTRYNVGDHFQWHSDSGPGAYSRRKITLATQLSDPADFEGGHVEFFGSTDRQHLRPNPGKGDGVVFPSWLKHRVVPVTKGVRWSLISWWTGPPFR